MKMKILLALSAVLAISYASPQRKQAIKTEAEDSDQLTAEQNYPQQEYRQQQPQEFRQQAQEYRQQRPIEDFRPKNSLQLETTTYIPIISFNKEQSNDGSYKTAYETGNHIHANEQGYLKNVGGDIDALVQQGSYSYEAPDGQIISVEYTADEFGFRVKGDHIPTPPPVSPEIQKGLDLIYAGIKANAERQAIELKNNPELAKQQQERAKLDYSGQYYQQ